MATKTPDNGHDDVQSAGAAKRVCGIIMPISGTPEYPADHWAQVYSIIYDVVVDCNLTANMVSDASDTGVIHSRIVNNILENPIVVCDVSSRNPNVMFELGIRLAYNKPAVIIKDSDTPYSFDTSLIEHLNYPKSLHYPSIVNFKQKLKSKIKATLEASQKPGYNIFPFVKVKPTHDVKEIDFQEYIVSQLAAINKRVGDLSNHYNSISNEFTSAGSIVGLAPKHSRRKEHYSRNSILMNLVSAYIRSHTIKDPIRENIHDLSLYVAGAAPEVVFSDAEIYEELENQAKR